MDYNSKGFKQIDNRGPNDLERIIDEQKDEINKLKKQVQFLQTKIRGYKWTKKLSTTKVN